MAISDKFAATTTLASREFNQDISHAKKAAKGGPVFITERGRPAYVVLTIEDYQRLTSGNMSLAEALAPPSDADSISSHPTSADVSARHQCLRDPGGKDAMRDAMPRT
jgi:prevent-host-death family protein